jgi:hypothetical protein
MEVRIQELAGAEKVRGSENWIEELEVAVLFCAEF